MKKIILSFVLLLLLLFSSTLILITSFSFRSLSARGSPGAADGTEILAKPSRDEDGSDSGVRVTYERSEVSSTEVPGVKFKGGIQVKQLASTIWLPILVNEHGSGVITLIPGPTLPTPITTTATPIPTIPVFTTCFDRTGPVITISGEQSAQYRTGGENPLPEYAIVDARSAGWSHVADYPVVLEGGPDICFSGGVVWGDYPYSTDWDTMHDTSAFTFRTTGNTRVENIRVHNYGDGISFSRGITSYSFHVKGAHMTHIRDDCVQNDYMLSGWIEDSFFDGCYTAFSAQSQRLSEANDGSQNVWTVRNSLIRLEPMEKVYKDEGLIPGHGAFFKWNDDDNKSPQLSLHDNIFRVDQPSNSNSGLGVPQGKLVSCSNNVVVWLGEGDYPDPLPERFDGQPCFTVSTDATVWDNAVQDWMNRH